MQQSSTLVSAICIIMVAASVWVKTPYRSLYIMIQQGLTQQHYYHSANVRNHLIQNQETRNKYI